MKYCDILFWVFCLVFYNAFWHLSAEYFYNAFDFKNKLFFNWIKALLSGKRNVFSIKMQAES